MGAFREFLLDGLKRWKENIAMCCQTRDVPSFGAQKNNGYLAIKDPMASPFKKLLAEWAKLRIAEPRAKTTDEKYEIQQKLNRKWSELLNFPGDQMQEDDFNVLHHLEDWTVDPVTTKKIGES